MITEVLFISEQFLKDRSPINTNVDDFILTSAIRKAQDIDIQEILGTELYRYIADDIADDATSIEYVNLLEEYIVPCLTEYALYRALPFIYYSISRKGVGTFSDEEVESSKKEDVDRLQSIFKHDGDWYAQRLRDHLIHNSRLYPQYTSYDGEDIAPDTSSQFSSPIYLGDRHQTGTKDWEGNYPEEGGDQ